LQPIGGSGKSVYVVLICLTLSIIGAVASRSYSKGTTAYISSNAPGASVRVDGGFGRANSSGAAEFIGLPFGTRSLAIEHGDYAPLSTSMSLGWLSGNRFSFHLTPIPLTLTVNTMPGAEVVLNGQSVGTANNQGAFVKTGVMPGDYDIQVTLAGYSPFQVRRHLSPKFEQMYAGLNISQEHLHQMQEEQRRAQENAGKVQHLLGSARQQFNSRQYQAALGTVDEALRIEPGNTGAQQLKNQIVQTMSILR
jgi:hypothetical protein